MFNYKLFLIGSDFGLALLGKDSGAVNFVLTKKKMN